MKGNIYRDRVRWFAGGMKIRTTVIRGGFMDGWKSFYITPLRRRAIVPLMTTKAHTRYTV